MNTNQDIYRNKSLKALFKNSLDAIISIDSDYCVVDINQVFIDMFGYELDEIKGKHVDDVMNMGKKDTANRDITTAVLAGKQVAEEGMRYAKNGKPIEVLIKGIPIIIDGKMAGAYGIYSDITRRKKMEKALQESEARNRAVLNAFPDSIFIYDREGCYLDYQTADKSLLYLEPGEFIGKSVKDILPEDVAAKFLECFADLPEKQQTQIIEYTLNIQGNDKHFEASITPMDKHRILAIVRDISERKQVEKELQTQHWRLESIIDSSNLGTWEWNLQSGVTVYNDIWAKIVGYTPEELHPMSVQSWKTLTHPEDQKKSDELINRHLAGELPYYECECRIKHKKGHWVWVRDRGRVISRTIDGKPLMIFGTHTDITERKLAEEKMRYLSFHDSLTGLYSRHFLNEEMNRLDTDRQLPISIIMADLNGLKLVNDTYGHAIGDEMLKNAASILKGACRKEDVIARWGGDEFVIILPGTSEKTATTICNRLMKNCSKSFVKDVPVSMALGIVCKNSPGKTLLEILKEAEDNMYKQKLTESRSTKSSVLKALLKTLEAKSFETEAHTWRMQEVAQKIGCALNLPSSELNRLDLLITLHDIGKINISEEILTKKTPLSKNEWQTIKKHPEIGYRIARATEEFAHIAKDILAHHERWDGKGYPQGLKGNDIPLLSRIVAIADAVEVMTNGRPYKKALSEKDLISELKLLAGKQFDPKLVELFLSLMDETTENRKTASSKD